MIEVKELESLSTLKGIANVLSAATHHDDFSYLLNNYQTKNAIASSDADSTYQQLHQLFVEAEQLNKLGTPIYTLTKSDKGDFFLFGITSSESPYYFHEYREYPPILAEKYNEGGVIPKYGDEHGIWISAFAPIKDASGKTLAVVQVDKHFDDFEKEARDEIVKELSIAVIITAIVVLVLWGVLRQLIISEEKYTKKLTATVEARTQEVNEQHKQVERLLRSEKEYSQELLANQEELKQQTEELVTINDHLKVTQKKLVQSEKMASLGQMTSGIAHEINNPLNFISGGVQSLRVNMDEIINVLDAYEHLDNSQGEEQEFIQQDIIVLKEDLDYPILKRDILDLLNDIELGTERVTNIVKSLKNFSVMEENKLSLTNIHEVIDATILLLKTKMGASIEVTRDYDYSIQQMNCYPGQLNQVFLHIIENAIDAMDNQLGHIAIRTQKIEGNAQITIADNGPGIPEEIQSKIFDPFFTTKDIGKGTGLGLSVSYGVIEKHQGKIELDSKLGVGTTFTITLPMTLSEDA